MANASYNKNYEEAARLRDEIKQLQQREIGLNRDPDAGSRASLVSHSRGYSGTQGTLFSSGKRKPKRRGRR